MGNSQSSSSKFNSSTTAEQVVQALNIDLTGKNFFITGANSGIGLEAAQVLARHNANIYFGARSQKKIEETEKAILAVLKNPPKKPDSNKNEEQKKQEEKKQENETKEEEKEKKNSSSDSDSENKEESEKKPEIIPQDKQEEKVEKEFGQVIKGFELELSSLDSVRSCAKEMIQEGVPLHYLINNAGIMACPFEKTKEGFEAQIGTNHFGHFLLSHLLTPTLIKSAPARVVSLASLAHKWGEIYWDDMFFEKTPYDKWKAYGQSKLANMLFALEYNRRYAAQGVTAYSLHPGVIATNLTRSAVPSFLEPLYHGITKPFFKSIPQGAATTLYAALAPEIPAGAYFNDCAVTSVAHPQFTASNAIRLWEISEKLTGVDVTPLEQAIVHNKIPEGLEEACFGGGCFWGMEKWFKKEFPGIKEVKVGFLGGTVENPSYKKVCTGTTGHAEVVHLCYDPNEIKYEDLVTYFFRIHDPTTKNRQANDTGSQYRSAIFFYSAEQQKIANEVLQSIGSATDKMKSYSGKTIVTEIAPATAFYQAEPEHQDYLGRNPSGYCSHKPKW